VAEHSHVSEPQPAPYWHVMPSLLHAPVAGGGGHTGGGHGGARHVHWFASHAHWSGHPVPYVHRSPLFAQYAPSAGGDDGQTGGGQNFWVHAHSPFGSQLHVLHSSVHVVAFTGMQLGGGEPHRMPESSSPLSGATSSPIGPSMPASPGSPSVLPPQPTTTTSASAIDPNLMPPALCERRAA
jgi:hypothetical protein